jgi:hypothetical protein
VYFDDFLFLFYDRDNRGRIALWVWETSNIWNFWWRRVFIVLERHLWRSSSQTRLWRNIHNQAKISNSSGFQSSLPFNPQTSIPYSKLLRNDHTINTLPSFSSFSSSAMIDKLIVIEGWLEPEKNNEIYFGWVDSAEMNEWMVKNPKRTKRMNASWSFLSH